ncbi:hypothetical protein SAY86_017007 [Trapa natans]|uniref:NAC domain-containing protein n=1 Tax=Trapa natans TaxID=22666 RepID=A0AAN7LJY6_TRANT|nr:hypothetical protein SAY86_017007 [Trapa natans]
MEVIRTGSDLPPGFRFHPTDEELIVYYLRNQAALRPCPVSIIPEVDIYKFDPWQLPEKAEFGEKEWYFFSPRDRKYPNGQRPNRATVSGYWKATGTDKAIYSGTNYVGVKKALVFYKGRPPKGIKSDWIMHEYRLLPDMKMHTSRQNGSMRLDDWVLCRIYKKKSTNKVTDSETKMMMMTTQEANDQAQMLTSSKPTFPRTGSLTHLLELDYWAPLAHLLYDGPPPSSSWYNGEDFHRHGAAVGDAAGETGGQKLQMKQEVVNQQEDTTGSLLNQFPAFSGLHAFGSHRCN